MKTYSKTFKHVKFYTHEVQANSEQEAMAMLGEDTAPLVATGDFWEESPVEEVKS